MGTRPKKTESLKVTRPKKRKIGEDAVNGVDADTDAVDAEDFHADTDAVDGDHADTDHATVDGDAESSKVTRSRKTCPKKTESSKMTRSRKTRPKKTESWKVTRPKKRKIG